MARTPTTTTTSTVQPVRTMSPLNWPQCHQAPTPLVPSGEPFWASKSPRSTPPLLDYRKGQAAIKAHKAQASSLDLRQQWSDAAYMRAHLRAAGLRVKSNTEPATVSRVKAKLRSVGIHSPEIQEAVGMPVAEFLTANPGLPLWAALALVLESTGRFTLVALATPEMGGAA